MTIADGYRCHADLTAQCWEQGHDPEATDNPYEVGTVAWQAFAEGFCSRGASFPTSNPFRITRNPHDREA